MRSLGARRVAPAAGAAMIALAALAGCSAGQVAETALLQAPVAGLSTQSPDGTLLIRNLQVVYNDPQGYPANGTAPIEVSLFNQTEQQMTVTITSKPQQDVQANVVSAQQIGLTGGAAAASPSAEPEPTGSRPAANSGLPSDQVPESGAPSSAASSAPPAAAQGAAQPAQITIPPLGSATYQPGGAASLQAIGLSNRLAAGSSLALTFQVSGQGQPMDVLAPVGTPASPVSRAPGIEGENSEGE